MNGKKPSVFLCRALLSSIGVLAIGLLGFGVRAFSTPDTTRLTFGGLVIISIGILVWVFMRRRSTQELTAHSSLRQPSFVTRSILPRLLAWRRIGAQWMLSARLALSLVWQRIGDGFLPRKAPMKPRERLGAEAGVVRVPKLPDSRRAA